MKQKYNSDEIKKEMDVLSNTFDVVRIVNPLICDVCQPDADGKEYTPSGCFCFEVWNKNERCKNCISALALSHKSRFSKFEYIGDSLYYIVSRYVEIGSDKLALECVSKLDKTYANMAFGTNERLHKIVELYQELRIDELTGLFNRRYIVEKLQPLIIEARVNATKSPVIAYIDLDHLKYVNDSFGHNAGDALIVAVCNTMVRHFDFNEDDFIGRMSGDEFVLCMGNSDMQHTKEIVEKIAIEVARTVVPDYPQLKPSISAGIAAFGEANTYDELMELADKRLRKAKELGRDRICSN